jgi:hypothetical protein
MWKHQEQVKFEECLVHFTKSLFPGLPDLFIRKTAFIKEDGIGRTFISRSGDERCMQHFNWKAWRKGITKERKALMGLWTSFGWLRI